jgi:hypothetical protein
MTDHQRAQNSTPLHRPVCAYGDATLEQMQAINKAAQEGK